MTALPYDQRPDDDTPLHTDDLPPTPVRDRNIPATAWIEAPAAVRGLGDDLPGTAGRVLQAADRTVAAVAGGAGNRRRRRGTGQANAADLDDAFTFRLFPDGNGEGVGPSGQTHVRFRTWKEDLRDAPR